MPPKRSPKKAPKKSPKNEKSVQDDKKLLISRALQLRTIENQLDNNLAHDIWPEMKFHNKDNTQYEYFSKKCNGSILKYIKRSSPYYVNALMEYILNPYKMNDLDSEEEDSEEEESEEESS